MAGWQQVHRRTDLLNAVLDDIDGTGSAQVPDTYITKIEAEFGGLDDFLLAAHQRWATAFAARLDGLLENEPEDLAAGLAQICAQLRPALRALLDHYGENAALAAAEERQWQQVAVVTGLTEQSVEVGQARQATPAVSRGLWAHCPGHRLLSLADRRIKRALNVA
jgi:hypothetical protein